MVTIRTGDVADIEAVLVFWSTATTEPSATDNAASVAALVADVPEALLLAVEADEIVGTVIVGWDGWRGAMYRLAVAPSRRRRGIASALVEEGERRLAMWGARRLHMIVASDQVEAQAFWKALGYAATDQRRFIKTIT